VNIPNALTLSRLGLAIVLIALLAVPFPFGMTLALVVFIVGGITDYLDGYLARNVYGETAFGSLMDPLTDKIMVCAAFVSFVELHLVKAAVVVVIIAREFMVTGLRLIALNRGTIIAAGKWGKHKTVWQIVAIIFILLGLAIRDELLPRFRPDLVEVYQSYFVIAAQVVSVAVAIITVMSGLIYLRQNRTMLADETR